MTRKKLGKKEKEILKEDIRDLKWLAEKYRMEGKASKAADCENEMAQLQRKLKGEDQWNS